MKFNINNLKRKELIVHNIKTIQNNIVNRKLNSPYLHEIYK